MSYRIASKLTFTPKWADLSEDERTAEQVAALEIVARYGGTIDCQYVLSADQTLLSIVTYPDLPSHAKAEMAIAERGAFALQSQPAYTLDEVMTWQADVRSGVITV